LLVPLLIGKGNLRYPFATGLNIVLSKPWLRANEALLIFSKQSLVGLFFFESSSSTSETAKAID